MKHKIIELNKIDSVLDSIRNSEQAEFPTMLVSGEAQGRNPVVTLPEESGLYYVIQDFQFPKKSNARYEWYRNNLSGMLDVNELKVIDTVKVKTKGKKSERFDTLIWIPDYTHNTFKRNMLMPTMPFDIASVDLMMSDKYGYKKNKIYPEYFEYCKSEYSLQ